MRADWVEKNPNAAKAILMAVMEAQQWCDDMANKDEMAAIIGKRSWMNVPVPDIIGRLKGDINYGNGKTVAGSDLLMKFWAGGVSYPFKSHDTWFMAENVRWGKFAPDTDIKKIVNEVNREDLWRAAAADLGVAAADIPATRLARRRNLLRWQDLRSGRSFCIPLEPVDQGSLLISASGAGRPRRTKPWSSQCQ